MNDTLAGKIRQLQGPILVLGASGFIGANLFRMLLSCRNDVFGTRSHSSAWRLEGLPESTIVTTDVLVDVNLNRLLDDVRPRTVFDCIAYGAYSFEEDAPLIYRTNVDFTARLLGALKGRDIHRYIHAGSSSEYGDNAAAPREDAMLTPNSHYAASKAAASGVIWYFGKKLGLPCTNLRLYSVYGPWEDSSRLMPAVVREGLRGALPPFVDPGVSRDFVYVDDACEAFVDAAVRLEPDSFGESFNIGSGSKVAMSELAVVAKDLFSVAGDPSFTMPNRHWDVEGWYADPSKARDVLGWQVRMPLRDGLSRLAAWYAGIEDKDRYLRSSKKFGRDEVFSVSAVIACYKDAQAIPIMYERLTKVFQKLNIGYEIIFVNDCSPDDSEDVIRRLSASDRHVTGITHSRNFGSQSAFRSGMEIATKNACVLLDGDLQDPPELIEQFVARWREGYEVVYGRRVKREAPWYMQIAYKLFYRMFDAFSYVPIPHDAGDFSLMTRTVVDSLLRFPERDLFMRGIRAFAGFRQTGVDYVRPERMFGRSTNNLLKNIGWAKKGILSFSNTPLGILSFTGTALLGLAILLGMVQVTLRVLYPEMAPRGATVTLLAILFFGSVNLFAISIVGEYIAKIFEEVKRRPHFIRRSIIRDGEVRDAAGES